MEELPIMEWVETMASNDDISDNFWDLLEAIKDSTDPKKLILEIKCSYFDSWGQCELCDPAE